MTLYDQLRRAVRDEVPVALATVVDGIGVGGKLLVWAEDGRHEGTLGDHELDRVVERDARGELAAGTSGVRHYGEHVGRLARVAHRLVWVNPLKASPGYAPLAGGMAAALPWVDELVEGHALASLEFLAALLSEQAPRRAA